MRYASYWHTLVIEKDRDIYYMFIITIPKLTGKNIIEEIL